MATVNITANMNEDTTVTLNDASAAAGKHLFKFFTDGINVFNIASKNFSSDAVEKVVVNAGVSYEFDITIEQAKLLNGVASTYKHYLLDANGVPTLKNEGTVTVTASEEVPLAELEPFINGEQQKTVTGTEYQVDRYDDTIYLNPSVGVVMEVWLPEANKIPAKKFEFKLIGAGDASILLPDSENELILLDTTGDSCMVRAKGTNEDDWQLFYNP